MPRLIGVDIPNDKRIVIALTYIYGVGRHISEVALREAGIDQSKRARELTEEELTRLANIIEKQSQGDRMLSRPASSQGSSGARAAHSLERSFAQGTAQDRGRQEGRQGSLSF
jgi:ribosomal protein S13